MLSDDGHALAHTGQASLTEDQQVYLRNVDSDVQEIASATGFGGDDWLPDWRLPAGPADPAPEIGSPPVASCSVSGPRVSFVADYQSGIYSFTCAPVIDGGFSGGLTSLSGTATVASAAGRVTVTVAITCGIFLIGCGGFMYLHYQDFPDGLKKDLVAFVVGGRCRWPDCRWPPRIWNLPIVRAVQEWGVAAT